MNEDGTPIETSEEDVVTDNIPASEGGETTTPDEVAKIMNLPVAGEEETEDDESEETDEESGEDSEEEADDSTDADVASEDDEADEEIEDEVSDDTVPEAQEFELKVEDVNGKEFTLKPGDNLEKALEEFEPKSNGQIMQVLNDFQKLEAEKAKFDEDKVASDAEAAHKAEVAKINEGWQSEIKELQGQKRLEVKADGKESPRVEEVFKFMSEENDKRSEKGRPLISSFEDALDKLELRERKQAEADKEKEDKETARKKGSIVGGSSAPASGGQPVYRGGARNATEAAKMVGLIK
jgi:hypothetical protein